MADLLVNLLRVVFSIAIAIILILTIRTLAETRKAFAHQVSKKLGITQKINATAILIIVGILSPTVQFVRENSILPELVTSIITYLLLAATFLAGIYFLLSALELNNYIRTYESNRR